MLRRVIHSLLFAAAILARPGLSEATRLPNGVTLTKGSAEVQDGYLTAGGNGAEYTLPGEVKLFLHSGTVARFESTVKLQLGKPSDPPISARCMVLKAGRIDAVVPADPTRAVLVSIPKKLDAVTKAGRSITIANDSVIATAAVQGEMLVGIDDKWKPLEQGFVRRAPDASTAALLAAPSGIKLARSLLLKRGSAAPSLNVDWAPLPGAASYEVRVTNSSNKAAPQLLRQTTTNSLVMDNVEPGVYAIEVRAIDGIGLQGAASKTVTARVLSLGIPANAVVGDDGTILLGRGQSAELVGGQGLELSYGSLNDFIPAPRWLGLARHRPASVTLRDPISQETLQFRLEPLELKAKIAFLSSVWPRRGLAVHVKLFTATGREVPPGFSVKPTLMVNVDTIALKWRKEGTTLSTLVPHPSQPGPWVVRVEIADESGELIGRDFVEIVQGSDASAVESTPIASTRP